MGVVREMRGTRKRRGMKKDNGRNIESGERGEGEREMRGIKVKKKTERERRG